MKTFLTFAMGWLLVGCFKSQELAPIHPPIQAESFQLTVVERNVDQSLGTVSAKIQVKNISTYDFKRDDGKSFGINSWVVTADNATYYSSSQPIILDLAMNATTTINIAVKFDKNKPFNYLANEVVQQSKF